MVFQPKRRFAPVFPSSLPFSFTFFHPRFPRRCVYKVPPNFAEPVFQYRVRSTSKGPGVFFSAVLFEDPFPIRPPKPRGRQTSL